MGKKYVGCCVNPGLGVVLRANQGMQPLEAFAEKNGCRLETNHALHKELGYLKFSTKIKGSKFARLSCKKWDADEALQPE